METGMDRLRLGQNGTVLHLEENSALTRRLQIMGMVPGTKVRCLYRSPGGSVTAFAFRGMVVALRTRDLKKIGVWC